MNYISWDLCGVLQAIKSCSIHVGLESVSAYLWTGWWYMYRCILNSFIADPLTNWRQYTTWHIELQFLQWKPVSIVVLLKSVPWGVINVKSRLVWIMVVHHTCDKSLSKPIDSQIAKLMWPTWGPSGSCRPHVGPTLALWILLSGNSIPMQRRTNATLAVSACLLRFGMTECPKVSL